MKTINKISILGLIICVMMTTACEPTIDNPYSLTGNAVNVPANFDLQITVSPLNDVSITFTRMGDIVDGKEITGFHIYVEANEGATPAATTAARSAVAGWSFQSSFNNAFNVNAASMATRRIVAPGTYTVRAQALSSAGIGGEKTWTFPINAPTPLRALNPNMFMTPEGEAVEGSAKIEVGDDVYFRRLVYLSNAANATNQANNIRDIHLQGDFANWDHVFSLDFFDRGRGRVDSVRYRGLTNYFHLYYDPARKHVFVEPSTNGEIVNASYQILSGTGLGRPTTVLHGAVNRFNVNNASASTAFQDRIVMWRVGNSGNNYQATVSIRHDAAFRVYDNTNRGGQGNPAWECVFIRTAGFYNLINHGRNSFNEWFDLDPGPPNPASRPQWWTPWNAETIEPAPDGEMTGATTRLQATDPDALYRITFNRSNREVRIVPVDTRGRTIDIGGQYTTTVTFNGATINTEGVYLARCSVTFTNQTRFARVAVVSGNISGAALEAEKDRIAALPANSTEFSRITATGMVERPFAGTNGTYSIIVVTYDHREVVQGVQVRTFEFPPTPPSP